MQIVINIPEELYRVYKDRPPMLGDAGMDMIAQAIANGTVLPKCHGRLKDVDAGLKNCMYAYEIEYWDEEVPTIIEADKVERR